ncbi:MAG: hypothetical protein MSA43_00675 [Prevotella sp.]|nr:hypothetical protein [Prevotella sp.]
MIRKTYGVSGLMDWTTQIKTGKVSVSVHFTGGALTAYGVTPAKYSTSNPFFQSVIENSEQFKSGRIMLLGEMEVPDDAATKARKARMAAKAAEKPAPVPETPAPVAEETVTPSTTEKESPAESEQPTDDTQDETLQGDGDDADGDKIKVADKPDAIEYLKERFPEKGYTAVKLRTKTAFDAACKECGVEFVFTA